MRSARPRAVLVLSGPLASNERDVVVLAGVLDSNDNERDAKGDVGVLLERLDDRTGGRICNRGAVLFDGLSHSAARLLLFFCCHVPYLIVDITQSESIISGRYMGRCGIRLAWQFVVLLHKRRNHGLKRKKAAKER